MRRGIGASLVLGLLGVLVGCGATERNLTITTIAGGAPAEHGGDRVGRFSRPWGIAVGLEGTLFVADEGANKVRRINLATGAVVTLAGTGFPGFSGDGGPAREAQLNRPTGIAVDRIGNIFIADKNNHRIRRVDAATGMIATVAGTGKRGWSGDGGPAREAELSLPIGIAVDATGNLYVADMRNHRIRKVSLPAGTIATIAGTGIAGFSGDGGAATGADLNEPWAVAVDRNTALYVVDHGNGRIRKVDLATEIISTVVSRSEDSPGRGVLGVELSDPSGVALDGSGNLFVADWVGQRFVLISLATGIGNVVAGMGLGRSVREGVVRGSPWFSAPVGVAADGKGNLFLADWGDPRIFRVDLASRLVVPVSEPEEVGATLGDRGPATAALLDFPAGLALDGAGNLFIADSENHRIRRLSLRDGTITTVAGSGRTASFGRILGSFSGDGGPATGAGLDVPIGLTLDAGGNLFIADSINHRVRRIDATTGVIMTVAGTGTPGFSGDGGPATAAELNFPHAIAMDADGDLFVAERVNHRIRKVAHGTGRIVTIAGGGNRRLGDRGPATWARLFDPTGVALDGRGNLYIAQRIPSMVWRVDLRTGLISVVAGTGRPGFAGDGWQPTKALLNSPAAVAVDDSGTLFIADAGNNRIRRVGTPPSGS